MTYEATTDIEKATHWKASKDEEVGDFAKVTPGICYPLYYDEVEMEYYLIDDEDVQSTVYLVHEGEFVINQTPSIGKMF